MLKSLELENFKAFGKRVKIPLAPITLIFGQNSAGKSSILQSLNLMKQTLESRDNLAFLLPRTENELVDLGSFQEMIFDHELTNELSFTFEFDLKKRESIYLKRFTKMLKTDSGSMQLNFQRPTAESEVQLKNIEFFCDILGDREKIASWNIRLLGEKEQEYINRHFFMRSGRRSFKTRQFGAEIEWLTSNTAVWEPFYEQWLKNRNKSIDLLNKYKDFRLSKMQRIQNDNTIGEYDSELTSDHEMHEIDEALGFCSDKNVNIHSYIDRMSRYEKKALIGMRGFLPSFPSFDRPPEEILLEQDSKRLPDSIWLNAGQMTTVFGRNLELVLSRIFPLGPFRRPPERWYIFTGTNPQDVGYRGNSLPDLLLREPKIREKANAWLSRLGIGYELSVSGLAERTKDLFEVRLVDTIRRKSVDVCLTDVGFGISQILPFVVQSLAASDQIITIEQPEVHIHPKLQADLGDLLVESIKAPLSNRFIIETHSEHLILRLLRRIRETTKAASNNEKLILKPEDISIVYVRRGENGSEVVPIPVNADGEFEKRWPDGFFAERSDEL